MSTLRQKVDAFCKGVSGDSDKLQMKVDTLKNEIKRMKEAHKARELILKGAIKAQKPPKAAKTAKAPKAPKVAKAPKVKQEVAMNPLPAGETAEQRARRLEGEMGPGGYGMAGGRRTRRRRL
jgi:hypothetical protein